MSLKIFSALFVVWFVGVQTNHLFGGSLHLMLALLAAPLLARIVRARPPFAGA